MSIPLIWATRREASGWGPGRAGIEELSQVLLQLLAEMGLKGCAEAFRGGSSRCCKPKQAEAHELSKANGQQRDTLSAF